MMMKNKYVGTLRVHGNLIQYYYDYDNEIEFSSDGRSNACWDVGIFTDDLMNGAELVHYDDHGYTIKQYKEDFADILNDHAAAEVDKYIKSNLLK